MLLYRITAKQANCIDMRKNGKMGKKRSPRLKQFLFVLEREKVGKVMWYYLTNSIFELFPRVVFITEISIIQMLNYSDSENNF